MIDRLRSWLTAETESQRQGYEPIQLSQTTADALTEPYDRPAVVARPHRSNGSSVKVVGVLGITRMSDSSEDVAPWRDRALLKKLYIDDNLSQTEIADRFECTPANISKWTRRHELDTDEKFPWRDENTMRELYAEEGLEGREIADRLGCSERTVEKWLSIHSLYNIDESGAPPQLTDERWLRERYKNASAREIAEELGCARSTVGKYLQRNGVDLRGAPPPIYPLDDADKLKLWYEEEGLTTGEIAAEVGCSDQAVKNWLRRHDIPLRKPVHERDPVKGEDHPRWNGGFGEYGGTWYLSRKKRLEFDDYQCVVCGLSQEQHIEEYGQELHVHHITKKEEFRRDDGTLDEEKAHALENLLSLCREHHDRWEGIPLVPEVGDG